MSTAVLTPVIHSLSQRPQTHCGIPAVDRPRMSGNVRNATCPDCASVRIANGWAA